MTIFLVEQNANRALKLADRGYVLENGRVVLSDTGDALLANEAVRSAYRRIGKAKGNASCLFSVFSLSLWERAGVRAPDRTQHLNPFTQPSSL